MAKLALLDLTAMGITSTSTSTFTSALTTTSASNPYLPITTSQLISLLRDPLLYTAPPNAPPVTQEYITKFYNTIYDQVVKFQTDISSVNDIYILNYLKQTNQSEFKFFDFVNANQTHTINKVVLALCHQLAIGTAYSVPKAFEFYKEIAPKNGFSAYAAGLHKQYGYGGITTNASDAFNFFKMAAQNGFVPAYNKVGLCYDLGTGVEVDKEKAFEWIQKSAVAGDKYGQYNSGLYYGTGNGCEKNTTKAFEWYLKAAEQGYTTALNKVGICYKNGMGTTVDMSKSFEWFKKAAEAGCKYGQVNMGNSYELDISTV